MQNDMEIKENERLAVLETNVTNSPTASEAEDTIFDDPSAGGSPLFFAGGL